MAMDKKQQRIVVIGSGIVILALLYRWYMNRNSASNSGTSSNDLAGVSAAAAGQYAALAGQEQSDMAAMQGQNAQLQGQEQSDVAALFSGIGGWGAQEQHDVAALQGQEQGDIAGISGQIGGFANSVETLTAATNNVVGRQGATDKTVASLASGQQKLSRGEVQESATGTIAPHKGKAFYNYYKRVTGKAPPAHVAVNNVVYEAWKAGLNITPKAHPSAPKQKSVAHPNPNHKPAVQPHHNPPAPKSRKTAPLPAPRRPAAKPKARPSGRRK